MIATITVNPAFDKICYVDNFEVNKVHRITEEGKERTIIGGKGINISVMLKILGVPSIAMGFAGGILGTKLELELRRLGIVTNFVRIEHETRTNIFITDNKNDNLTVINVSGKSISDDDLFLFMDRYRKVLNQVHTVILAGSLLPNMDSRFYGELVQLAKAKNVRTIVHSDPKYLDSAVAENAYMIFPDMRSTTQFRGGMLTSVDDCIACGKTLIDSQRETEILLFSHLVEHIVAVTRKKAYVFSQKELSLANLFGFGDAIVSGTIYGLEQDKPLKEALSLGSAAGYTTVERQEKFGASLEKIIERESELHIKELEL